MQCFMCPEQKRIINKKDFPVCPAHKYLLRACLICFELFGKRGSKKQKVIIHCPKCKMKMKTHKWCLAKFAECAAKELKCFFCYDRGFRDRVLSKEIPVPEGECLFNEDQNGPNKEITCNTCLRDVQTEVRGCQACGLLFHEKCLFTLDGEFCCSVCIVVFRIEVPTSSNESSVELQEMSSPAKEYIDLGTIDLSTDSENDDPDHLFELMDRQPLKRPRRMPNPLPPPPAPRCRIDPDSHHAVYHSEEYCYKLFQE